jgi:hypothetical protein
MPIWRSGAKVPMQLRESRRHEGSDRIGSQVGGLPTGSTGGGIVRKIPPVDLWATLRA